MKELTKEKIDELWLKALSPNDCIDVNPQIKFALYLREYLAEPEQAKVVNQELEDLLWEPKLGDDYYIKRVVDGATKFVWEDVIDYHFLMAHTKLFKTRESAIRDKERDDAILECNKQAARLILSQHPVWVADSEDSNQLKYIPLYNYRAKQVDINCWNWEKRQWTFIDAPAGIWGQIDDGLLKKAMGIE